MFSTRISKSWRPFVYLVAITVMAASIVALINRNNTSGSTFAQDGPTVEAPSAVFTNAAPIAIGSVGAVNGNPYPSAINVTGLTGNIAAAPGSVKVTINAFEHTFQTDVVIVLVGPGGQALMLQGRPGNFDVQPATTYTFSDTGTAQLTQTAAWGPGTYKPTNFAPTTTSFPAPGPGTTWSNPGPTPAGSATFSSVYGGTAPNGTWNLYVRDLFDVDGGQIGGGWSIDITTEGGGPTPTPTPTPKDVVADFDADGKTDPAVLRAAAAPNSPATWWVLQSQSNTALVRDWGSTSDTFTTADFDGDLKDDIAIWRPGVQGQFWIIRSTNNTVNVVPFGTNGDDATVVGDYNADGVDDVAVYRPSATAGGASTWWWMTSANVLTVFAWGTDIDFPAPGDYDGDNRADYAIQRPTAGVGNFWIWRSATSNSIVTPFGTSTDSVVPGDYDGDLRTDLAVIRVVGGSYQWTYRPSAGGADVVSVWGDLATDLPAPGDYNGDGRWDFAIWRVGAPSAFWVRRTDNNASIVTPWGAATDVPVTLSYVH